MTYTEETIANVMNMLNNLTVKGVADCRRVALISQLLENPEKENENGEH